MIIIIILFLWFIRFNLFALFKIHSLGPGAERLILHHAEKKAIDPVLGSAVFELMLASCLCGF